MGVETDTGTLDVVNMFSENDGNLCLTAGLAYQSLVMTQNPQTFEDENLYLPQTAHVETLSILCAQYSLKYPRRSHLLGISGVPDFFYFILWCRKDLLFVLKYIRSAKITPTNNTWISPKVFVVTVHTLLM